ncbi:hypothetical protein ACHZ98_21580, partial [Streptomyces sp. MAR4 CNY-716]
HASPTVSSRLATLWPNAADTVPALHRLRDTASEDADAEAQGNITAALATADAHAQVPEFREQTA